VFSALIFMNQKKAHD